MRSNQRFEPTAARRTAGSTLLALLVGRGSSATLCGIVHIGHAPSHIIDAESEWGES